MATKPCSLVVAVARLKSLQQEIGNFESALQRSLSEEEWVEIKMNIGAHQLPCLLRQSAYGFCLVIHDHGYLQGIKPDQLLVIDHLQFPFPSAKEGIDGQSVTLRILRRLTHTRRNHQLLAWYGFEPQMPSPQYVY